MYHQHCHPFNELSGICESTVFSVQIFTRPLFALILSFLVILPAGWAAAAEQDEGSKLLEAFKAGGHVALMRHALAPGVGDPGNFRLGDCATQRNLSDSGRDQANRIGMKLRQAGITQADVYTSQWCRCRETAALLSFGEPVELPALNSFFRDFSRQKQQTETLRNWLTKQQLKKPLILVTHQVNITALSSIFPKSGEMVLMRRDGDGRFQVVGSIFTN